MDNVWGSVFYIMRSEGTDIKKLTRDTVSWERSASFSPDGSRVVFVRYTAWKGPYNIFVINMDGTSERCIYSGDAMTAPYFSPDGKKISFFSGNKTIIIDISSASPLVNVSQNNIKDFVSPYLSSDGKKIVFCKVRNFKTSRGGLYADSDIFTVNSDGSNLEQVTNTNVFKTDPFFSPDVKEIYFFGFAKNKNGYYLWRINIDGTNLQRIK